MAVEFLSEDWAKEVTTTLNSHDGFRGAIQRMSLSLQFHVTDVPARDDIDYFVQVADGKAVVRRGILDDPDVSITNTYETAEAISKGELNTQSAFITGRIKVEGNLAKLMMHQASLQHFANAVSDMEVEY